MFQRATKKKSRARVALIGPSGSGKTYTALTIARGLGGKIAVIDTERGSASKYSGDVADFDVCELTSFEPQKYIDAMADAAASGYDAIVIDSLSHAWMGEGGILDQKDKKSGGGSFNDWRTLTPQHNALVNALLSFPGHLIGTMRVKTEYVVEKDERTGKSVPRKVGLAPVQRDGLEYEFDVVADIDPDHCMHVTKSRCPALADAAIRKPGADVAKALRTWLDDGVDEETRLAGVLARVEGALDLDAAAREVARAAKLKLIDADAVARLKEAGAAARERVSGAAKVAEGSVS